MRMSVSGFVWGCEGELKRRVGVKKGRSCDKRGVPVAVRKRYSHFVTDRLTCYSL